MQPCQEYEALISAVADGEATDAERRALMEHLSRCERCRETYTQTLLLHDAFSQWEEEAPEGLLPAVMDQVRREPRQRKRHRRSWMPLMAAAACLALIIVGFQVSGTLRPAAVTPPQSGDGFTEGTDPAGDAALTEDAGLSGGDTETENTPASQDSGVSPAEEDAKDPQPHVGSDVTQYGTGTVTAEPRAEFPQVTAFAQAPPSMTVTCADPALLTWMEANVDQAGTETEAGIVWVIPTADWLELEVRLLSGGSAFTISGAKISDQLAEGDLVEVIYQPAAAE